MRKREKRVRKESHRLGTDRRGFGWASRQAGKRSGRRGKKNRKVAGYIFMGNKKG